jgi:hypothetical protein
MVCIVGLSIDTVHKPSSYPPFSTTVTSDKDIAKLASPFTINDSEGDDEEDQLSVLKKGSRRIRAMTECMQLLKEGRPQDLLDEEVIALTIQKKIPLYALEKTLKDLERAVKIRRAVVCMTSTDCFC